MAGFDRTSIVEKYNSGTKMQFVFFWRHYSKPGKIEKACLSQWYPCHFTLDGVSYYTTEQYMMAQKALLFEDHETYKKIMRADNPADYKALGRKICNFREEL